MTHGFEALPFRPADILLPRDCDLEKWSVVACDQYTSQPEYWERVARRVGKAPSSLRLILPESSLEGPNVEQDITEINLNMARSLRQGRFQTCPECLIYVERTLSSGAVRRGLLGMADLEAYDYEPGAETPIRPTEGTIMSRIPPRVKVRKNAPIELPHSMLLVDDPEGTVIRPLGEETGEMELLYDFELMEGGGHLRGWKLTGGQMAAVAAALTALARRETFEARYGAEGLPPLLFAVGDGNHSLVTAKECYEQQKRYVSREEGLKLPSRHTLVELVALQDESLDFKPIHRVVFGAEPEGLLADLAAAAGRGDLSGDRPGAHILPYVTGAGEGTVRVERPAARLPVGTLQTFLDAWLRDHPGARVDYIHGEEVARELAARRPGAVAFLLPAMGKEELFPTAIHEGILPRKTFSMGEAQDKRFYLEARKIR